VDTEMMWGRRHRGHGDGACGVKGVAGLGSGKMATRMEGLIGVRNDDAEALGRSR
jgi:hypothetical protein